MIVQSHSLQPDLKRYYMIYINDNRRVLLNYRRNTVRGQQMILKQLLADYRATYETGAASFRESTFRRTITF